MKLFGWKRQPKPDAAGWGHLEREFSIVEEPVPFLMTVSTMAEVTDEEERQRIVAGVTIVFAMSELRKHNERTAQS